MFKFTRPIWIFFSVLVLSIGITATARSANETPHIQEARISVSSFYSESASQPTYQKYFSIPEGALSATFESAQLTPQLSNPFDVLGVSWEGSLPEHTQILFWVLDTDGTWVASPLVAGESKDGSVQNQFITQPVVLHGTHTRFKVTITRDSATTASPEVNAVQLIAVNAGKISPLHKALTSIQHMASGTTPNIISREEWGADESYRFTSDNTELWPAQYQTPEKFIIHHTAGSTGGDDPAATVRAIYYWHAQVLGWGDIGYNYLLDENGNIYEGRYGGEGVIGAHAYNDVREINYNEGSIGIALLGCFEADDDGACSSIAPLNDPMMSALSELIGTKGWQLKIRPKHKATLFHDIEIPNIVGHRDVDYTLCPGSIIDSDLKNIREDAQAVYNSQKLDWKAKFDSVTGDTTVASDTDVVLTTTWKNTGSQTWSSTDVFLKIYDKTVKHPTPLAAVSWTNPYGKFYPVEASIAPGESATFLIPLHTLLETKQRTLSMKLAHQRKRISTTTEKISINTVQSVAVSDMQVSIPLAVLKTWRLPATVSATNVGTRSLPAGTELQINEETVATLDAKVTPGATAEWNFTWTPPQKKGVYTLEWRVVSEGSTVSGSHFTTRVRVDPK